MAKKELTTSDETYCMLVADRGYKFKKAYKIAIARNHKTERALDAAVCRFNARPEIKARIKEIRAENNQIRKESVRDIIKEINYDKKKAYEDYKILYGIALDKKNAKAGVSAIDSIVKLLGLAEETAGEVVFKILGSKEKKDAESDNNSS
jgi:translation initiation factor 2 beta subunit (eIF-2beta)/eIF-5